MNRYTYEPEEQQEQVKIHCTDNDKIIDAVIISKSQHSIVMTIYDNQVRLTFVKLKPNVWVANREGYEFVYQLK